MKTTAKLGAVAAAGALAIAVPAMAKPPYSLPKPHPPKSHRCAAHNEAYIASGKFVSWNASPSGKGRYTGTITVDLTRTNHHAAGQKGTRYTYTLTNTKVDFGKGANPPVAGDRVVLIGKITAVARKCTDQSAAGKITLRKADISVPKAKHTK